MHARLILSIALLSSLSTRVTAHGTSQERPSVTAVLAGVPPRIDGLIDNKEWENAATIEKFTQILPTEGGQPTEKTVVLVQYDADNLYLAIKCFDSEPNLIAASQMQREGDLSSDDKIEIVIGSFADKRNGYYFAISAAGAKVDGLVDSQSGINLQWDALWHGVAKISSEGWTAEIAIPFKSISFQEGASEWGFNITRTIRRKQETIDWSMSTANQKFFDFQETGTLKGVVGLRQGMGLTVEPYGAIAASLYDGTTEFRSGLNMAYKLTSSTTAQLTVNTDFAEAETDQQLVNLSRFPVFFPEKRAFFLQDASIFTFGGIQQSPIPFYSRRIGIVRGGKKDIFAGMKITGREGNFDFGVLDVQMYDDPELGRKNLAAARVSADILEQSSAGVILTHGDPATTGSNTLIGGDFTYRNSHVFGDNVLQANAWSMASFSTEGPLVQDVPSGRNEDDFAFGTRLNYPNDKIAFTLYAARYGTHFRPALGFIQRPGTWELTANGRYRWRMEGFLRSVNLATNFSNFLELDGSMQTLTAPLALQLENADGDILRLEYVYRRDVLDAPFNIIDNIVLPVGAYDFHLFVFYLESSRKRALSGILALETGRYFNGIGAQPRLELNWRPNKHFLLGGSYQYIYFDFVQGKAHVHIARAKANLIFTPSLSWNTLLQYDTISRNANVNSVVSYEISPGQRAFLVVNQDVAISDGFKLTAVQGQISMKLGMTLIF